MSERQDINIRWRKIKSVGYIDGIPAVIFDDGSRLEGLQSFSVTASLDSHSSCDMMVSMMNGAYRVLSSEEIDKKPQPIEPINSNTTTQPPDGRPLVPAIKVNINEGTSNIELKVEDNFEKSGRLKYTMDDGRPRIQTIEIY